MATTRKTDPDDIASQKSRTRRAAVIKFSPNRALLVVSEDGINTLKENAVSTERVGWKAFGLSCLPPEWVPQFFVIDGGSLKGGRLSNQVALHIRACLSKLKIEKSQLFVRSSGAAETIEQRGRLVSEACNRKDIQGTILKLSTELSKIGVSGVHWIVQEYVKPLRKGHLSNERRLSREPRDFVAEFEPQGEIPGHTIPVAVRHWRDGSQVSNFDLSCSSEAATIIKLRQVALWTLALPERTLLEWVWTGSRLWIVQADPARASAGINPNGLRCNDIPKVSLNNLQILRPAAKPDFERYRKLRNARTYSKLGYQMPTFYVLDDQSVIRDLFDGRVRDELLSDLEQLTQRPLIIRTDGLDVSPEKREMLPRSEDLRSAKSAKEWLTNTFSAEVRRIGIGTNSLALIAHHFIPSIAAAWARSEPESSIVRIESLWGLPEGLYWHSHDTFEVDADGIRPMRKRLRFKGTFVASDNTGRWIHYSARAPHDWGRSIRKRDWLMEIAKTTREIANQEKHAVTVMWLVDNAPNATPHQVLPWYHTKSELNTPKAAPRHKLSVISDFRLETARQWDQLKSQVLEKPIDRVLLLPSDPELVRNQRFAKELAEFAAHNNIVIEIAGGILSHAYHILRRHGAQVECIDLFGAEEEAVQYNKLVRDKIPGLIKRKGESVDVVRLKGEALLAALRQKLVEESYEAVDANPTNLMSELADIQEVVDAIRESLQVSSEHLNAEKEEKRKRRGRFRLGIMLRNTSTPHTLVSKGKRLREPSLSGTATGDVGIIEQPALIPSNRPYRRPDLRNVDDRPEAVLNFEIELSKLLKTKESAIFHIPISESETRAFRVSLDLERRSSSLWGQIKLREEPSQMKMLLNSDAQMELKFPKPKPRNP